MLLGTLDLCVIDQLIKYGNHQHIKTGSLAD